VLSGRQALCGELSRLGSPAYAPHAATAVSSVILFGNEIYDLISAIALLNRPPFNVPYRRLSGLLIFSGSENAGDIQNSQNNADRKCKADNNVNVTILPVNGSVGVGGCDSGRAPV
jgi:hypothetical protein